MTDHWKLSIEKTKSQAEQLKSSALNRHDSEFILWHAKARAIVIEHAPVKLPAFEEIRFASDFLLSKPENQQTGINDRMALMEDLDLTIDLLQQTLDIKAEADKLKSYLAPKESSSPVSVPPPNPNDSSPVAGSSFNFLSLIEDLNFSERERQEIALEIKHLENTLNNTKDWDAIKRSIKYLLDFDQTLARRIVPVILGSL